MNTETMIRELRNVADKYRGKVVYTGEVNITLMCEDVAKRLEELSQPKTDWISCEERLPNKHDDYIVTYKETNNGKIRYYTSEAWFKPQICEWCGNVSIPNLEREVIAWQEKLKPYEEATEREDKCLFEQQFPRGDAYVCKKTALICTAEKLKYCKYKQSYEKEGGE